MDDRHYKPTTHLVKPDAIILVLGKTSIRVIRGGRGRPTCERVGGSPGSPWVHHRQAAGCMRRPTSEETRTDTKC